MIISRYPLQVTVFWCHYNETSPKGPKGQKCLKDRRGQKAKKASTGIKGYRRIPKIMNNSNRSTFVDKAKGTKRPKDQNKKLKSPNDQKGQKTKRA